MQICSFSIFFSRELYSSGVLLLARNADILVHLIQRSLKSVQRFPLSLHHTEQELLFYW